MRYIHIENSMCEVRELPLVAEADDLLPHLQALVGGYLEALCYVEGERPGTKLCAMCNEDGRRLRLPLNIHWPPVGPVLGPVIVVGIDGEGETTGLTDAEIERVRLIDVDLGPPVGRVAPRLYIAPHILRVVSP